MTKTSSLALSVAAFSLALVLAGCSSGGAVVEDEPQAAPPLSSTPSETPAPVAAEAGTRDNPVPSSTPAKHSDDSMWKYSFGATVTDAWPAITAENQFNQPAPEGSTYITVPVHVMAEDIPAAAAGADPWASFKVEYVTAGGNTFGDQTCAVVLPAPGAIHDLGMMYGGAEADFLACAAVPTADIPGGTWKVSSMIDASFNVFFVGA